MSTVTTISVHTIRRPGLDSSDCQAVVSETAARPTPVMLVISSLEAGGAERQVIELANHLNPERFDVTVCSLSEHVPLATGLRESTKRLTIVPRRRRFDWSVVQRLARVFTERQTQIAHAFLFDAEIVAALAARRACVPIVLCSERNTDYVRPRIQRLCYRLFDSRFGAMIANSAAGKEFNVRTRGFPADRIYVVRNAVDVQRFQPMDAAPLRRELGIKPNSPVIGMVAHFKRQKRHADFFEVAQIVREKWPTATFLCAGEPLRDNLQGADDYHREMRQIVERNGLRDCVRFLGRRTDMPEVYSACDVTVLTSSREGTPNVLLESMACQVPVVATNVSDNAAIVPHGQTGYIVKLGDSAAMAGHISELLNDHGLRRKMGVAAREWVRRNFSPRALAANVAEVYETCLATVASE